VEGSPNFLAWLAISLALPVSVGLVRVWRVAVAVPIVLLLGQLFLPSIIALDAPLIPPMGKEVLVPLGALIGCVLFRRRSLAGERPFRGYDLFITVRLIGLFGTYMTNRDSITFGPVVLPALTFHDFFSTVFREIIYLWPAFFLGRTVIRTSGDLRNLFKILTGAGVIYSAFMFVELIISPQLNRMIYGYHQAQFLMAIRGGGYRPMVFMRHGINVAFFISITVLAATALGAAKARVFGVKARVLAIYLLIVLVLAHSLGALIYGVLGLSVLWLTKTRTQTRVAAVIAVLAFSYPVARATGLVPVDDINAFNKAKFGAERADSLGLRLSEEEWLMNHAMSRMVFGWGGYARGFRHDPITGQNTSTTDGVWAMEISINGAFGFITLFGMILLPAWRGRAISRKVEPEDRPLVACLALIAAIYGFELIPNSSSDPYLTFLVGVLAGIDRRGLEPDYAVVPAVAPTPVYGRRYA
jgi:hypothetical protein